MFEEILQLLDEQAQLADFQSVVGTLLIAMDGTEYFFICKFIYKEPCGKCADSLLTVL